MALSALVMMGTVESEMNVNCKSVLVVTAPSLTFKETPKLPLTVVVPDIMPVT
jgi:hypothetical protein